MALTTAVVVLLCAAGVSAAPFSPAIANPDSITQYRNMTHGSAKGALHAVAVSDAYDTPIIVADLYGANHYDVGYAYGNLLAQESNENYYTLLGSLLGDKQVLQDLLALFLDWQYDSFLAKGLPQDFIDEMQGVTDGATAAGFPHVGRLVKRGLTLASIATGDVAYDIETLVKDEFSKHGKAMREFMDTHGMALKEVTAALRTHVKPLGKTCSMFGVWGSRTEGGNLYTGRNLDWEADTGVAKFKTVTVYHIGARVPYASVGFAAITGAITGLSKAGITVHEAGDDNSLETLEGFAWGLRLRMIMENATNLAEAKQLWEATNNTLGINHGIGSAADKKFMALETRAGYTAYFEDNDPREAAHVVNGTHYGFPITEAVWRTNHGYDPTFLQTAKGGPVPGHDSQTRYLLIHDTIMQYKNTNTPVTFLEAVNITAVAGDKGGSDLPSFVTCSHATNGANIISATFNPASSIMYLAFENGRGSAHVPACCNKYVKLDMTQFF